MKIIEKLLKIFKKFRNKQKKIDLQDPFACPNCGVFLGNDKVMNQICHCGTSLSYPYATSIMNDNGFWWNKQLYRWEKNKDLIVEGRKITYGYR